MKHVLFFFFFFFFYISFSFSVYLFIYFRSLYFVHLSAWESTNLSKVDKKAMTRTDVNEFHILPLTTNGKETRTIKTT